MRFPRGCHLWLDSIEIWLGPGRAAHADQVALHLPHLIERLGPLQLSYLMYLAEGRLTKAWKIFMQSTHPPFVINPEFSDSI